MGVVASNRPRGVYFDRQLYGCTMPTMVGCPCGARAPQPLATRGPTAAHPAGAVQPPWSYVARRSEDRPTPDATSSYKLEIRIVRCVLRMVSCVGELSQSLRQREFARMSECMGLGRGARACENAPPPIQATCDSPRCAMSESASSTTAVQVSHFVPQSGHTQSRTQRLTHNKTPMRDSTRVRVSNSP